MCVLINLVERRKAKKGKVSIPFGERVAIARNNQEWSQERLGFEAKCSQSLISRIEAGVIAVEPDLAISIAKALHQPELLESYPVVQAYLEMQFDPRPSGPAAAVAA